MLSLSHPLRSCSSRLLLHSSLLSLRPSSSSSLFFPSPISLNPNRAMSASRPPSAFDKLMSGARAAAAKKRKTPPAPIENPKSDEASATPIPAAESKPETVKEAQEDAGKPAPAPRKPRAASVAEERTAQLTSRIELLKKKALEFDPSAVANWGKGDRVPFMFVALAFDLIDKESKRIVITDIVCNMLRTVIHTTPEDLLPAVYLSANKIAPAHEGLELGIGDASIIKALAEACGKSEKDVKKRYDAEGDLGIVAQNSRSQQKMMWKPEPLTVTKVFNTFRVLAKDVDCMPSNPLDNMPEALKRQNIAFDKFPLTLPHMNGNLNFERPVMNVSSGLLEKDPSPMNTSLLQGKGDINHIISQPKGASADIAGAQTAVSQPGVVAHNQGREADIQALSDLNRALDKKKALLMELSTINNILENQNSGECSLKDCDKKHYATVLVQLKEASGQESSALLNLRHRNTYPGNTLPPSLKYPTNSTVYGSLPSSFDISTSQESGSSVAEIVEVSRLKAHTLVNAAVQAMSSRKEGEEAYVRVRRALDSINIQNPTSDSRSAVNRTQEQVNGTLGHRNQLTSGASEPNTSDSSGPKLHTETDKNESQMLSEVITACVMAMNMIQTCTERQYPPAVVAQVLDYAVTSLHPRCPQNVGMYREIQMCMGRIKAQILALVPT